MKKIPISVKKKRNFVLNRILETRLNHGRTHNLVTFLFWLAVGGFVFGILWLNEKINLMQQMLQNEKLLIYLYPLNCNSKSGDSTNKLYLYESRRYSHI